MRRIVMRAYQIQKLHPETLEVLKNLQKKRVVSLCISNGWIGIARHHVDSGKDSRFRQTMQDLEI